MAVEKPLGFQFAKVNNQYESVIIKTDIKERIHLLK